MCPSEPPSEERPDVDDFESAAEEAPVGLVREFVDFLREDKKWWLVPIIVVLLLLAGLVLLGPSFTPFIYTLF